LVRNAQATPGLRLEYLCDLDAERAHRVLGGYSTVRVSRSLDEVLADPAVHAATIATPAATHLPVAVAALEAGKHVLVEKQLAAAFDGGRKLVDAAESRGLTRMLDLAFWPLTT
jgi:predicted dehydrogenase